MLCVALLSFSLFNFVGDPINNMVGEETSTEERAELRETLGLNDPIHIQFGRFVANAAQFNFGKSYQLRRPVSELIAERMPATLELVIASSILALGFGVFLGVYTGINRTGILSNIILFVSLAGVSLPTFVIGILLIYIFAVILGVLPSFGRGEVVQIGFWSTGLLTASGLKALILPSLTLSLFQMTYIIRLVGPKSWRSCKPITSSSLGRVVLAITAFISVTPYATAYTGCHNCGDYWHARCLFIITETVFPWLEWAVHSGGQIVDIPIMSAYLVAIALVRCYQFHRRHSLPDRSTARTK